MYHALYDTLRRKKMQTPTYAGLLSILYNAPVSEYLLSKGSIETNSDGEIIGASLPYFHLIGEDITDVIQRPEVKGIRKAHPDKRLSSMQRQDRAFRLYGKGLLRERQPTSR